MGKWRLTRPEKELLLRKIMMKTNGGMQPRTVVLELLDRFNRLRCGAASNKE
jgi:hypothetical protein